MSQQDKEITLVARRWVLTQLALIRDPRSERNAASAGGSAFRQHMGHAHSGWDAPGSDAPDWASYWEADQQAVNAYAAAMITKGAAERDRLAQVETASDDDLLKLARENLKEYQHSYPRPVAAESVLIAIDSRIQSASRIGHYYDHFRDEPEERQIDILEKLTDAALMPKEQSAYDRAAIYDFAVGLISRLKDGGRYIDSVHKPLDDRLKESRRPKGRPGNKPMVRDAMFLALVQEVVREFGIPAERNDRERRDGAVHLVGEVIDEVFRQPGRYSTGLVSYGDKPAAVKLWERHRKAQKG
ncbi:hypothetical protein [Pseudotabrizicola sp. 4114]|uniref:hypothetical protein n=1 Tax=Pseudotabrizicola sp. 4114 TaxID=2817731 RepID=UPI00286749CA|nr:hypothetical protein [Pseudorhodobacter sp. 4114]